MALTTPQLPALYDLTLRGFHPVLQEDFNSLDISTDNTGLHAWYPGLWWEVPPTPSLGNYSVVGSELVLTWNAGQTPSSTDLCSTRPDFLYGQAFRYGYFEAVMRWTQSPAIWPAFWLTAASNAQHRGELDIMEAQGAVPTQTYSTWHEWFSATSISNNAPNNVINLAGGFNTAVSHRYGMLWEPGSIIWFIDGVQVLTATPAPLMDSQYFEIVLTLDAGLNFSSGNFTGLSPAPTQFQLFVDSVQVWQHN